MKNILSKLIQYLKLQKNNYDDADTQTRNIILWAVLFAVMGVLFLAFSNASPLNK